MQLALSYANAKKSAKENISVHGFIENQTQPNFSNGGEMIPTGHSFSPYDIRVRKMAH